MKSFDCIWEKVHKENEWGKYPSEYIIRFVARNYYNKERNKIRILDFGCGAGANTWFLAREGFDTYAFDGSKSAVEKAKKYLNSDNLYADFRVRDALQLDYQNNFFDCIIDGAVIYANTCDNIKQMYTKCYELLKDGGKIISIVFSKETTGYGTGKQIEKDTYTDIECGNLEGRGTTHFFEEEDLYTILMEMGYKNISIENMRYTDNGKIVAQYIVSAQK